MKSILVRKHKAKLPGFMVRQYGSSRKFRAVHRARLQGARAALMLARQGCAWSRDSEALDLACQYVEMAIEHCKTANWERGERDPN